MIGPLKQIFIVPASGPEAALHYRETIQRKRLFSELTRFLPKDDLRLLSGMYHESPFAVWGALPTKGNHRTFGQMKLGDYILFWQKGRIVLIGEIAWKVTSTALAQYFWKTDATGKTWENIYFIINEQELDILDEQLWHYLEYEPRYSPQGLMQVEGGRVVRFEGRYGGFRDVLIRLSIGSPISERSQKQIVEEAPIQLVDEEGRSHEHDEIQWRLIRLGRAAQVDVWIPKNDQHREWEGHRFRDYVLPEFKEGLDIPKTVENIDTVWRLGYSIKAAIEVEHSTSIYSGLLRLSDLKAVAPNTLIPLYIAAPSERKDKVISELKRPTFHDQLRLHEVTRYVSYEKIRELDKQFGERGTGFNPELLETVSERVA